jgi:hypothetical protein
MRENRPYGSEGGGTELNRSSLPLLRQEVGPGIPTMREQPGVQSRESPKNRFARRGSF